MAGATLMPDLITHSAFSYMVSRSSRFDRFRILFYVGTVLPDVLSRPIYIINPFWYPYSVAVHTPVFLTLFSFLFAELFQQELRRPVRLYLIAGVYVHLLLDFFQRHIEAGYLWFFPFSWSSFEVGLFWPETPLMLTPVWLLAVALAEATRYLRAPRPGQT
jgi:hypothetical protein